MTASELAVLLSEDFPAKQVGYWLRRMKTRGMIHKVPVFDYEFCGNTPKPGAHMGGVRVEPQSRDRLPALLAPVSRRRHS